MSLPFLRILIRSIARLAVQGRNAITMPSTNALGRFPMPVGHAAGVLVELSGSVPDERLIA